LSVVESSRPFRRRQAGAVGEECGISIECGATGVHQRLEEIRALVKKALNRACDPEQWLTLSSTSARVNRGSVACAIVVPWRRRPEDRSGREARNRIRDARSSIAASGGRSVLAMPARTMRVHARGTFD